MKNIKVSVGLSVFNEGNNIANVIRDILHQKQEGWKLMEVLVFDDGSNDSTVKKAKGINNRLLKIVEDGTKKGKTHRLSQMFKTFKGEVLVMFDGDVRLVGENVITKLVESFNDPFTMLVGGNSQPFSPKNFFQRAVYTTFSVFYRSRIMVRGGNNIFGCTGSILAIRNTLARKIMMPSVINEDAYIYLYCLNEKYKFSYQDKARVMYKLPSNLGDYIRQAFRSHPEAVGIELKKYFGSRVDRELQRPMSFYLKSVLITMWTQPFEVLFISFINILCRPFYGIISSRYKLSWFTAASTH